MNPFSQKLSQGLACASMGSASGATVGGAIGSITGFFASICFNC